LHSLIRLLYAKHYSRTTNATCTIFNSFNRLVAQYTVSQKTGPIHCSKLPNYDFCISQGSVATVLARGSFKLQPFTIKFRCDVACQKVS